jgi:hypothetical protein
VKNNLIASHDKKILYLSETYAGSVHDKSIVNDEKWEFPDGTIVYQDSGFQGFNPSNVITKQPMKKPKGKDLTEEQKAENKKISAIRIRIEHIIGSVKIFRIVKDTIRNWSYGFKDRIMEMCCALHNFKLIIN